MYGESLKALTKISEARFIHQNDEKCLYKSVPGKYCPFEL